MQQPVDEYTRETSHIIIETNDIVPHNTLTLAGLDTATPLMQLGNTVWEGKPTASLGSILLFSKEESEFLTSTSKVIKMQRMKVTPKSG
jgi:TFIIIC subunit triple barrel domain